LAESGAAALWLPINTFFPVSQTAETTLRFSAPVEPPPARARGGNWHRNC